MDKLTFLYSFRARLLLLLATLLVATLGVQYYLNLRAQQETERIINEQEKALAAGFALGVESISSNQYMPDIYKSRKLTFMDDPAYPVKNILVVDEQGRVTDSLIKQYGPQKRPDGQPDYTLISQVPLPPLEDVGQSIDELKQMLGNKATVVRQPAAGQPRAVTIRAETSDGTNFIIVVIGSPNAVANSHLSALRPLRPVFVILFVAMLIAGILVWQFTRTISELSNAARRVAAGDFHFHIHTKRRDEIGSLALVFNDMIARLGKMRELETRLNQVERSAVVGRLASAIAHEIRNPLNYINLTLDHLRATLAPEDEKKRALFNRLTDGLKTEVARINTRITEFLKYSRPSKLNIKPIDLRAQIEDALRIVEAQAAESNIKLEIVQKNALPPILGDAESLRSVFTNLIINGVQAINGSAAPASDAIALGESVSNEAASNEAAHELPDGALTVTLSSEDGCARVDVTDTGRGIAPEHISQIFEPYFSTKETGTGLGLAIAKKAVEDHHGTIRVSSKLGEGTTFTVTLPIKENDKRETMNDEAKK
jgi:signal transduction histidine kinase